MAFLRKRLLIYPRFQMTLVAVNLAVLAGMMLAACLAVHRSYSYLREQGIAVGLSADHPYFRFVSLQSKVVFQSLALSFAIGLILSAMVTLFVSHRLAGPVLRLREYFRGIGNGEPARPLSFRKNDYLGDLPGTINRAIEALKRTQGP